MHRFRGSRPTRRIGIAMLEVIVALTILTGAVFATIGLYTAGLNKLRATGETAIALEALQNELETLRTLPFGELATGEQLPFRSVTPGLDRLVGAAGAVDILETDTDGLRQVTVRVRWRGEHGRSIEKSATTLVADKGPRT